MTADAAGEAAPAATPPQPVQILPRAPLTLTLVGDPGAACEGDACAI
ncbi:hypothetical protein N1027_15930 [Herbiconiux sp. CPCC 205763]|uniref:Uncharacterized protein n=1 Tax=Herbiconiux aconitum TaxID=2970913 RepID=A0ABT2GTS2_9MICO|nr:hypothetical protein [Herbiconiux aconitum]MCS5719621.1 hypothetical protein [Herbiconiux aconitum]